MELSDVTAWIQDHLPEVILLVGGLLAVAIALTYVKNKDSGKYKVLTALGVIFGVLMAVEAAANYGDWRTVTSVLVAVAAFTLIIRPFREVHFAAILGLFVMVIVYIWFGGIGDVGGIDLSFLSENPVRIIVAFIVGAVFYALFNFAESIVKLFGKLLNWWPLLLVLGLICVIESLFMFMGYGSIIDYIEMPERFWLRVTFK